MPEVRIHETRVVKLTYLASAFAEILDSLQQPLGTDYQLYLIFRDVFRNPEGLYLRNKTPSPTAYRKTRNLLVKANKLAKDADYPWTYRVLSKQDLPAEEVCCLVDSFCYISHISAMQRYGLTDRRPEALHITVPSSKIIREMINAKMEYDFGKKLATLTKEETIRLTITHHPETVRKRKLVKISTSNYGEFLKIRGSYARISTVGQTFLDMLEEPGRCGGMVHVIEVWRGHAQKYLNEIVMAVNRSPKAIHKIRAGYILDEVMNLRENEIENWVQFAQRGGSRVLDPSKPFKNKFSEKWMVSINV